MRGPEDEEDDPEVEYLDEDEDDEDAFEDVKEWS